MADTLHLALPYLAAAQAQKHVTLNEALRRLDAIVQLAVDGTDATVPPETPAEGSRLIVGPGATGLFAGQDGAIAHFVDGAWMLLPPEPGWVAVDRATGRLLVFAEGGWTPPAPADSVAALGVNTAADATNRFAVRSNAVLLAPVDAAAGGTGDMRLALDKEAAGDTVSLVFQTGFSGRAEFGLAGGEDFSIKVSPDGATWFTALAIDRATGVVSFPSGTA
ncbi:DUF2793 domain-containing protein [Prosthecomicrobium pneumaticum]|uniref:DUF2793 domain-containing protein n=1 Tax=Prosthecomicrobium pneumaticum TaxID=81895 RepID=A0A7W9FR33_9HYPH|nr:DUF2793 domain-containing protein [Prosthecomicrobium pneumaticum]MBB5755278.1 hypothetical protein [Prosthecomicrobium pneumaticum]